MMTRQTLRQAKRRLSKNKFPFPQFARVIFSRLQADPKIYLQARPKQMFATNLRGEIETLDLPGLYQLGNELRRQADEECADIQ